MPTPLLDNRQVGPEMPRPNLVTNGGFEVWQRGTNAIVVSNGLFTADRWQGFILGTSSLTVTADATNQDVGSWRCAQCVVGGGATVANPAFIYQNVISGFAAGDGQQLRGRMVALSARVKTSVAGAVRLNIGDATASVNTYSQFHTGSGQYETLTAVGPYSAGCVNGQVQVIFGANGTHYVDNLCLTVGLQPAFYVPDHPADELMKCLRYYEAKTPASYSLIGQAVNTLTAYCTLPYLARKAVSPTLTITAAANWSLLDAGGAAHACTSAGSIASGPDSSAFQLTTGGGLVAGNAVLVLATASPAQMFIEGNP